MSAILLIALMSLASVSYGAVKVTVNLAEYNKIKIGMTKAEVVDLIGGPGTVVGPKEPISPSNGISYRGAADDPNAVKDVSVWFEGEDETVSAKEIAYAIVYNDFLCEPKTYIYTGKAQKLTVPSHVSQYSTANKTVQSGLIKDLWIPEAKLTALDVSKCTKLTYLGCSGNKLTKLDVTKNKELRDLECNNNKLTKLNVTKNEKLQSLDCGNNKLTKLNVTKNKKLQRLNCAGNRLTKLDINKNTKLADLECWGNKLTTLSVSKCTKLTYLGCSENKLTKLNVTKNKKLQRLDCRYNKLKALSLKGNTKLSNLYCEKNKIKSLNVSKNKKLCCLSVDKKLKKSQLPKGLKNVVPTTWKGGPWEYKKF
jgi:Leucine-rich repeat (LRR) protein